MERSSPIASRVALGTGILALALAAAPVGGANLDPQAPATWEVRDPDLYGVDSRGDRVWAVGYWGTVLHSEDGGATWERRRAPTQDTLFGVSFADDRHGWAVGEKGLVLRSTDGGATWVRQEVTVEEEGESRPLDLHLFGIAALSPTEAWAVGDLGVVIRVRDGQRWERVPLTEETFADGETPERILNAVDFHDREHGWIVGEFGTVLRTADGGETWIGERRFENVPADLYLFDVAALDTGQVAAVGLAGRVVVSRDGGATWTPSPSGLESALYGIAFGSPEGVAVGDRGEIVVTADGGASWRPAPRPPLFDWLSGVSDGGRSFYAVGERGVVLRWSEQGSWVQLRGHGVDEAQ